MNNTPVFVLFSGGKDSFATALHMQEKDRLLGCIAIETGISTPDWKQGVEAICKRQGWHLEFIHTTDSYERVVLKYGFPGPAQHNMFKNYLKGRAVRVFKKRYPGAVLASGVRTDESSRRALSVKPESDFEGVKVLAPIHDWTTDETWRYVHAAGYERPHPYHTLQISGDCLCGAFAEKDERDAIRFWYPEIDKRLIELERKLDPAKETSRWGWGCNRKRLCKKAKEALLCVDCGQKDQA